MVNAGLEGFVRAASIDLPRGLRVNVVSPPWVTETLIARGIYPSIGLPPDRVAKAYLASVEGTMSRQVIDPRKIASAYGCGAVRLTVKGSNEAYAIPSYLRITYRCQSSKLPSGYARPLTMSSR